MIVVLHNSNARYHLQDNEPFHWGYTSEFSGDRWILHLLGEVFEGAIALFHATSFYELRNVLEKNNGSSVTVFSNFQVLEPPDWKIWVGSVNRNLVDEDHHYGHSRAIFELLMRKFPDVNYYIVTGAAESMLPDHNILSLGQSGRIVIKRKCDLAKYEQNYQKAFLSYVASKIFHNIQPSGPSLHSDTMARPQVDEKQVTEILRKRMDEVPMYHYDLGDTITIGAAKHEPTCGVWVSTSEFTKVEEKFFYRESLPHSTFACLDAVIPRTACFYCGNRLYRLLNTYWIGEGHSNNASCCFCSHCGWWAASYERRIHFMDNTSVLVCQRVIECGELKVYDTSSVIESLADARDFLDRKQTGDSQLLKETVASVLACEVAMVMTTQKDDMVLAIHRDKSDFLLEVTKDRGLNIVRKVCGVRTDKQMPPSLIVSISSDASDQTTHAWPMALRNIEELCQWMHVKKGDNEYRVCLEQKILEFQFYLDRLQTKYRPWEYVEAENQEIFEF